LRNNIGVKLIFKKKNAKVFGRKVSIVIPQIQKIIAFDKLLSFCFGLQKRNEWRILSLTFK